MVIPIINVTARIGKEGFKQRRACACSMRWRKYTLSTTITL